MSRFDRLSTLISRFTLSVTPEDIPKANLVILEYEETEIPSRIVLSPLGEVTKDWSLDERPMFTARTEWGGTDNPLFAALPQQIELRINADDDLSMLVRLLKAENEAQRCGSGTVLDRLGEVLMVRLLRSQIERGHTAPGLLGGLADPRLSRSIVAIHEAPGKVWKNEDLAAIANLSKSRFSELFNQLVGETPQAYLRRWRMTLARQDVEHGERIQTVAWRYGYGSSEALSKAFRRQFGSNPMALRKGVKG